MGPNVSKYVDPASKNDLKDVIILMKKTNNLLRQITAAKIVHIAVKKGNIDIIRYVGKKEPAALEKRNSDGETVTHVAAKNGRLDIIQYVADKRPSFILKESESIAEVARENGNLDMILYIAQKNPLILANQDRDGNTLLHLLIRENVVDAKTLKSFVEREGLSLSKINKKGETIAHIAARNGNLDIIRYVAEEIPTLLTVEDYEWNTVIHLLACFAAESGRLEMMRRIIEENPNLLNRTFPSFCKAACMVVIKAVHAGHCDIVRCIVEKYPVVLEHYDKNGGGTLVHIAARNGNLDVVLYLIEKKPSFTTEKDQYDNTILHLAAMANVKDMDAFRFLVEEKGIPLQVRNRKWETVLDIAVQKGNLDMIRYVNQKIRCVIRKKTLNFSNHKCGTYVRRL